MNTLQAPFRVSIRDDASGVDVELRGRDHFPLYPRGIRGNISERLSARMIDLLRISQAVIVADGLIRRRAASAGYRDPRIQVDVIDADFWNVPEATNAVKTTVDFLSGGDNWEIAFVPDGGTRHQRVPEFRFHAPTTVCLYSGGLDSAAGLASRMQEQPDRTYIPVVIRHQFHRESVVANQFKLLNEWKVSDPTNLRPLIVGSFVRNARLVREFGIRTREPTHRCRAFLFTAISGIVAAVEGSDSVEIYESGVGAVNLPLMHGMEGWRTTRSTHPYFLESMSRLVSLVAKRPITFELPFIQQTKAELVGDLARRGQGGLALATVSCIMHPWRRGNTKQCGHCPACIYRRYAMQHAGISESPDAYHFDLFGSPPEFKKVSERHLRPLIAFLRQVDRLADLGEQKEVPTFFRNHLLGTKVVRDARGFAPFVDLFRRYRHEWLELAATGIPRQWLWADWLAPRKAAV